MAPSLVLADARAAAVLALAALPAVLADGLTAALPALVGAPFVFAPFTGLGGRHFPLVRYHKKQLF